MGTCAKDVPLGHPPMGTWVKDVPLGHPPMGTWAKDVPLGHPPMGTWAKDVPLGHPPMGTCIKGDIVIEKGFGTLIFSLIFGIIVDCRIIKVDLQPKTLTETE